MHKGNRENIPAIKDCNGRIITDATEEANMFNAYYSTVFSNEGNILHIQGENADDPFTTDIKTIRRIKGNGKNKAIGPDWVSGEILKLVGEAMIPYLARLLDITMSIRFEPRFQPNTVHYSISIHWSSVPDCELASIIL